MGFRSRPFALAVVSLAFCASAQAQAPCVLEKLSAQSTANQLYTGTALAISGDWAAAGAPLAIPPGFPTYAGAVFLYRRVGLHWFQEAELLSSEPAYLGGFGSDVALAGNLLVVGETTPNDGRVNIYEELGGVWSLIARFSGPPSTNISNFGFRVATDGVRIAVGAQDWNGAGQRRGGVFVFEKLGAGWAQTQELAASDGADFDQFGFDVAIDGEWLAASAPYQDDADYNDGAIYLFRDQESGFVETQKLLESQVGFGDALGWRVAMAGNTLFASSPYIDGPGVDVGAVEVFVQSAGNWSFVQRLAPSLVTDDLYFGATLAGSESALLVGATGPGTIPSAAYLFEPVDGTWIERARLTPPPFEINDNFGSNVALDGDRALIGESLDDERGTDDGAFYPWSISGTDCPTLGSAQGQVSLSAGGTQLMNLDAGPSFANDLYFLVGSSSGTDPGVPLAGMRLPLNLDDYFDLTLQGGPLSPLSNNIGALNGAGTARVRFDVPPASDPSLAGLQLYHAFVLVRFGPLAIVHTSNPLALDLVP